MVARSSRTADDATQSSVMTLALRRIVWSDGTSRPDDYNIIHGDQIVGRMYRMNEPSSMTRRLAVGLRKFPFPRVPRRRMPPRARRGSLRIAAISQRAGASRAVPQDRTHAPRKCPLASLECHKGAIGRPAAAEMEGGRKHAY